MFQVALRVPDGLLVNPISQQFTMRIITVPRDETIQARGIVFWDLHSHTY